MASRFQLSLTFFLCNLVTSQLFAEDNAPPETILSKAANRLEVVGSIRASESANDKVGIVIFRDTKNNKSIVVPIGRPFQVDKTTLILKEVRGKTVVISDGTNALAMEFSEGRYAKNDRSRNDSRPSYTESRGNEDFDREDLADESTAELDNETPEEVPVDYIPEEETETYKTELGSFGNSGTTVQEAEEEEDKPGTSEEELVLE